MSQDHLTLEEEVHLLKKTIQELEGRLEYSKFMIKTLKKVIDDRQLELVFNTKE